MDEFLGIVGLFAFAIALLSRIYVITGSKNLAALVAIPVLCL